MCGVLNWFPYGTFILNWWLEEVGCFGGPSIRLTTEIRVLRI